MDWKNKTRWDAETGKMVLDEREPSLYKTDPEEAKRLARELYMTGNSLAEITRQTGIRYITLVSFVEGKGNNGKGWEWEKTMSTSTAAYKAFREKTVVISEALDLSLNTISKSLANLNEQEEPLTLSQIRTATTIAKDLYYMHQLAIGEPTEIHGKKDVPSFEEVWKILKKADPDVDWDKKLNAGTASFN